jgi:uncharacterized protein YjbI with pentapeptide repeats
MSEQIVSRPLSEDRDGWRVYWKEKGQEWRTEPEIGLQRQSFLKGCRGTKVDVLRDIYPFKEVKLERGDVEWLLATHENGRGPVDWEDVGQRGREGLDLRGADLCGVDLRHLPLARLRAGLYWGEEEEELTRVKLDSAAVHMENVDLRGAHLEGARMYSAYLQKAAFHGTYLMEADFSEAHMINTTLYGADMEGVVLRDTHLEDAYLYNANLERANLRGVFFGPGTVLELVRLGKKPGSVPRFVDVHWQGVNLSVLDWSSIAMLGDEYVAGQEKTAEGVKKKREERLEEYLTAVRANRQLAVVLGEQGLNEDAMRFAYQAQKLQRSVYFYRRRFASYWFSCVLDLLAGYGYKPLRCFIAYVCVIVGFATVYYLLGPGAHLPLTPLEAVVFSMTSFHGRGFSPGQNITLGNPLAVLAAAEAFVGLVIEVTFIASFTQRIFGK